MHITYTASKAPYRFACPCCNRFGRLKKLRIYLNRVIRRKLKQAIRPVAGEVD